ncbi:MAG TPA: type II toxin-antitoxin system Phd/YefM family antitoxin [Candidatus Limnocylindrales bacterium]|jgi:prevent-host-death family protein
MKTLPISELRQRTAQVLDELRTSGEPFAVLQRSQKAAYLVGAEQYEALLAELRVARRALLLREVREAEAEYAAGSAHAYDDMDALLADLRG